MTRECERCGKEFRVNPKYKKQRFCSKSCSAIAVPRNRYYGKPHLFTALTIKQDAAVIHLSDGQHALVDVADFPRLIAYRWSVAAGRPMRRVNDRSITMHRDLLGDPIGRVIDHINGNPLDNRRANLRICSQTENIHNSRRKKTSAFKGVYKRTDKTMPRPWRAEISANGKRVTLGGFSTAEEAARAYDAEARKRHGAFACVNFPNPGEQSADPTKRGFLVSQYAGEK